MRHIVLLLTFIIYLINHCIGQEYEYGLAITNVGRTDVSRTTVDISMIIQDTTRNLFEDERLSFQVVLQKRKSANKFVEYNLIQFNQSRVTDQTTLSSASPFSSPRVEPIRGSTIEEIHIQSGIGIGRYFELAGPVKVYYNLGLNGFYERSSNRPVISGGFDLIDNRFGVEFSPRVGAVISLSKKIELGYSNTLGYVRFNYLANIMEGGANLTDENRKSSSFGVDIAESPSYFGTQNIWVKYNFGKVKKRSRKRR